ncbi:uncharacterized protein LOC108908454 isoform X2 [Anoplophora glabripennis]|nr:uncharacterized protein LOC108908454 isoform X2 [Anoplophora glabripennis]
MWISSEDLRTEGSSDEETQGGSRGRRTKKNRKQRKSGMLDSSKSTSSLASTSSHSTESSMKDIGGCTSEIEKSTIEANIDLNSERFSVLHNPFFTDIFPDSAAGTSGISLASSDSGMDALNLESRWRPKRGSLKYPILVEGTSVEV